MIVIKDLSKTFGKKTILKNLNCTIQDHSIYGLVGANGAGKSTLLRILSGVIEADSGTIQIDQENYLRKKDQLVFIPDDLFFYPSYTLLDMGKFYESMYPRFDISYFQKLTKLLRLPMNKKISTFSKGMKRQCAILCALATKAKYMLFDETFDGIDPVVRNTIKKLLAEQIEKEDATIIMTSHNLRELEDICDNLGLLYQGGILFESEINDLKTNMFKVQISLSKEFDRDTFHDLHVLSYKRSGSVATLIIQDDDQKSKTKLEKMKPLILDFLPLTLEEIFIYEMEVLGYAFDEII